MFDKKKMVGLWKTFIHLKGVERLEFKISKNINDFKKLWNAGYIYIYIYIYSYDDCTHNVYNTKSMKNVFS